jgi:hypothetical protein
MFPMRLDRGLRICNLSTEYLLAIVAHYIDSVTYEDITHNPYGSIYFAFIPVGTQPTDGDWIAGEWSSEGGDYFARILIGPDSDCPLGVGSYDVWTKLVLDPEKTITPVGSLEIY